MIFFDSLISDFLSLTEKLPKKTYPCCQKAWNDIGYSQVILQRDTAFELDGTGFNLVTSSPVKDEVIVVGQGRYRDLYN